MKLPSVSICRSRPIAAAGCRAGGFNPKASQASLHGYGFLPGYRQPLSNSHPPPTSRRKRCGGCGPATGAIGTSIRFPNITAGMVSGAIGRPASAAAATMAEVPARAGRGRRSARCGIAGDRKRAAVIRRCELAASRPREKFMKPLRRAAMTSRQRPPHCALKCPGRCAGSLRRCAAEPGPMLQRKLWLQGPGFALRLSGTLARQSFAPYEKNVIFSAWVMRRIGAMGSWRRRGAFARCRWRGWCAERCSDRTRTRARASAASRPSLR